MSIDQPQPAMSEAEADQRIAANGRDITAVLAKADNRMRAKDHRAANAFYGQVGQLAGSGVAIERSELLRARDATVWLADQFRVHLLEGLDKAGLPPTQRHPRFQKSLEIMLGQRQRDPVYEQFPQAPMTYFYPDLPYVEYVNPNSFPWRGEVEAATDAILAEAQKLLGNDGTFASYVQRTADRPQGDVHGLLDNSDWSTFELTAQGSPVADRIALCPITHKTITATGALCDVPARAPTIMFSLLKAKSRIPPHTGMINARLICHLPLIIPGEGALRVGRQTQKWEVGKLMAFDDTVEHEAWNDAAKDRLVLIFDVWRPDVSLEERAQINALFACVDSY
ncbi:MAG: aspartyl/asparaginyl beta-hydroxylase domain-containing protein [Sphingomonadaceae bacterium]|nr:aspartyl/asparaginyl beta-hydroxylase domain-containing protein [Sphingomonadaceae bacterium]